MNQATARQLGLMSAITVVLSITAFVDVSVDRVTRNPLVRIEIPKELAGWRATDRLKGLPLDVRRDMAKIYGPLDNKLTWLRYEKDGQPFVQAAIQQAANFENIHDLYSCMVLEGDAPRRLHVIHLRPAVPAVLLQYQSGKQSRCALFLFQSQAMSAVYPAESPWEHVHLALVGRVPCRLVELSTPSVPNQAKAIERLKLIAKAVSELPI